MSSNFELKYAFIACSAIRKIKNWPAYFCDLFNRTKTKDWVIQFRSGEKFFVRSNSTDRGIVTTVAVQDEYKLGKLNLSGATILDIGGQNGYFSVFASKYAHKIYTFEPFSENYKNILKNIKLNNLKKTVIPHNLAVSDKKKKLKIYLSPNTGGHSMFGKGEHITVQTTTIPHIFEEYKLEKCDLLKMDVEGSEYDILYSLPDSFFSKILRIRMEVHECDTKNKNPQSMITFLKEKGYAVDYKAPIVFASNVKR